MSASDDSLDRLERSLGRLLQAGVFSSAACLAVGLFAWMFAGPSSAATLALTIGLVILMATPILRVVVSLVAYVRMRDWFFVATTMVVLLVLFVTIAVAMASAA